MVLITLPYALVGAHDALERLSLHEVGDGSGSEVNAARAFRIQCEVCVFCLTIFVRIRPEQI